MICYSCRSIKGLCDWLKHKRANHRPPNRTWVCSSKEVEGSHNVTKIWKRSTKCIKYNNTIWVLLRVTSIVGVLLKPTLILELDNHLNLLSASGIAWSRAVFMYRITDFIKSCVAELTTYQKQSSCNHLRWIKGDENKTILTFEQMSSVKTANIAENSLCSICLPRKTLKMDHYAKERLVDHNRTLLYFIEAEMISKES